MPSGIYIRTEKHKEALRGHTAWNKGMKGYKHSGSFQKGHRVPQQWRDANSKSMKEQYKSGKRKINTKSASDALRNRTRQRELSGNMTRNIEKRGYWRVYTTKGWVKEHHYIWIQHNQMPVPQGCVIHHLNNDKLDNRIENLQLLPKDIHNKLHTKNRDPTTGRFVVS